MILRKPYAFFIKYFRIINLVMALLMAILIYQSFSLSRFLRSYIADYNVANTLVIGDYINFYSFLFCFIIIALIIIVMSVMFIKKKPVKLYLFNLLVSIFAVALYIFDYNILNDLSRAVIDIRLSKAARDVTYIVLAFQIISFLITLVRATGFDLKSFDFRRDLQELQVDVKDNEEFEVAVELDRNKAKRDVRAKYRNIKYFYAEHKFIINLTLGLLVLLSLFIFLIVKMMYTAVYSEGASFSASNTQFNVRNSYITNRTKSGEVIAGNKNLVIIKLDIWRKSDDEGTLNTGLITLNVAGHSYGKTTKYNASVDDIGEVYTDQVLSSEAQSYVLVFEIPEEFAREKMRLKINDNLSYVGGKAGAKNIFVKLKPENFAKAVTSDSYRIGDTLSFSGSMLGESVFKISKYEMNDKFKLSYNFCLKQDKCYASYEYLTPTATGNYFKTLMKIDGEFEIDETMNISDIYDVYTFLNNFATIYYEINGNVYNERINSERIKPKANFDDGFTYIEVNKEMTKANSIYLILNIRNYTYKYTLK